jgi:tRNA modification GTPase
MIGTKPAIVVLNKSDLPHRLRLPAEIASTAHSICVSATQGDGLDVLRTKLAELAYCGTVGTTAVDVAINERQKHLLECAKEYLTKSCNILHAAEPLEIASQQLRCGLDCLGGVIGKTSTDDILERIFSTFCIGK